MPRRSTRNTRETERYEPETFTRRENLSGKKKQQILRNSKNNCANCGKGVSNSNSHIDHIEPFAICGDEDITNLQCICTECHYNKTYNTHERHHINNCRNFPTMRLFEDEGSIKYRNYHSAIHKNPNLSHLRSKLSNELGMELDEASELWYWDYPFDLSRECLNINVLNCIIQHNNKHYMVIQPEYIRYFIEIFADETVNKYYIPIYNKTFCGLYDKDYIDVTFSVKNIKSLKSLYEYVW